MSYVNFVMAQVLGMTATLILCFSYMVKSKKKFLLLTMFGDIVYGLSFLFVNSYAAGIIVLLSCVQNLFFLYFDKKNKSHPIWLSVLFIISFIICGLLTFNSMWDIIPIVTYIWFTVALHFKDMKNIRLMSILPNMLLMIYDIMVMAYASAFEDGIETIFIISIISINYFKFKKTQKEFNLKQMQH